MKANKIRVTTHESTSHKFLKEFYNIGERRQTNEKGNGRKKKREESRMGREEEKNNSAMIAKEKEIFEGFF